MAIDIKQSTIDNIHRIEKFYGSHISKWRRNLRLYCYSPTLNMNNLSDSEVCGYFSQGFFDMEDDTTSSIQENVIYSTISTLTSKIASQKVRPYFNTINGTFKDMKIVKQAQIFFDQLYDSQDINKQVSLAFRDSCIFDTGVIYIDRDNKRIERVMPWQIFVDPYETSYGRQSQLVWKREYFPTSLLNIKTEKKTITLYKYWNMKEGIIATYIPEEDLFDTESISYDELPFVFLHYETPIKGTSSQSVVDLLYGIQMEIDSLMTKIKDASQLSSPLKYLMPENSTVKTMKLTNRVGEVITYTPIPGQSTPPVVAMTEPFMDPQWLTTLETLKQHAYEIVGISQLSATSQKPQGLNSGIALSTMEDIESDRFETQLNQVIRAYVTIAKKCLRIFDRDTNILPESSWRSTIKWGDIVEAQDDLVIQFSAAEALSKDPSTKIEQINSLIQMGIIPRSRATQLMEIPDLQTGYSFSNNALNAVLQVIDDCIENGNYEIPIYIPRDMLREEIINTMLSLKSTGNTNNEVDIEKLKILYSRAIEMDNNSLTSAEYAAVQSLSMEMSQAIPQIQQQIEGMVGNSIQQFNPIGE